MFSANRYFVFLEAGFGLTSIDSIKKQHRQVINLTLRAIFLTVTNKNSRN